MSNCLANVMMSGSSAQSAADGSTPLAPLVGSLDVSFSENQTKSHLILQLFVREMVHKDTQLFI